MKNKFKYFVLFPLMILIVILTLTYDVKDLISLGVRIPFGASYWKDSLSDGISTNKSIYLGLGDSLKYNGVTVTSGTGGGGIAASDNITFSGKNTFQYKTIFSDTLKADGLSLIDNARITSDLNVTGDVISDLNFLKGSSTSIGTISTDSLAIITNNIKRIVINKNGYTNFTDTVQMSDYVQIIGNLNVGTNITALGKVTADSLLGIGYYITDINAANIASGKIDSARIPNTAKIDTANFAHTNSGITEIFNSIVSFATTVTFTVSPVFSALVNFANGIYVAGYSRFGELARNEKKVTKAVYLSTTNQTYTVAHGIPRVENVTSLRFMVKHDSTGGAVPQVLPQGYNATTPQAVGNSVWMDSLNCSYYLTTTSYGLIGDSAIFEITYTDNF